MKKIIILLMVVFSTLTFSETKFYLGIDTRHYLNNQTENNDNKIMALKIDRFILMSMLNSNRKNSIGVIYSQNITSSLYGACGGFTGYADFKCIKINDTKIMDMVLIKDDILLIPMLIYEKELYNDISLNLVFTPMNVSCLIGLKLN